MQHLPPQMLHLVSPMADTGGFLLSRRQPIAYRFYAKAAGGFTGPVTVSIESADGKTSYASTEISGLTGDWKKFEAKFEDVERCCFQRKRLQACDQKRRRRYGCKMFRFSLPSYKNRENGNRVDVHGTAGGHEAQVPPVSRRQLP